MQALEILDFTEDRLRPQNMVPDIRLYRNGRIYIYRSLLKKLGISSHGDKILFSYLPKQNSWLIRKNDHGIPVKYYTFSNNTGAVLHSSILRKTILDTHNIIDNTQDAFYMNVGKSPFITLAGVNYYEIKLIV